MAQQPTRTNLIIKGFTPGGQALAADFLRAAMRGARLLGLSRLKDRASPSWSRTKFSVRVTASSRALSFLTKDTQAIDSVAGSYSHRPTRRPRSTMAWLRARSGATLRSRLAAKQERIDTTQEESNAVSFGGLKASNAGPIARQEEALVAGSRFRSAPASADRALPWLLLRPAPRMFENR